MTAIAVGVAIAIGAGYWIAHLQNAGNPVPLITESQAQSDSAAPADGERKMRAYAQLGAVRLRQRGRGGLVSALAHGGWTFFRGYVVRLGLLDEGHR